MDNPPSTFTTVIETIAGSSVFSIIIFALIMTGFRLILEQLPDKISRWFAELCDSLMWAAIVVFMLLRPFVVQPFNIPSQSMEKTLLVGDYVFVNKALYRIRGPVAGEVVVFRGPNASLKPKQVAEKTYLIKRCVGTPGETVNIETNADGNPVLYRNGKPAAEPYAQMPSSAMQPILNFKIVGGRSVQYNDQIVLISPEDNSPPTIPAEGEVPSLVEDPVEAERLRKAKPEPIPPGKFLMVGDNRPQSFDGRFWGLLDRSRVMGRAEVIWMPISRWGRVR